MSQVPTIESVLKKYIPDTNQLTKDGNKYSLVNSNGKLIFRVFTLDKYGSMNILIQIHNVTVNQSIGICESISVYSRLREVTDVLFSSSGNSFIMGLKKYSQLKGIEFNISAENLQRLTTEFSCELYNDRKYCQIQGKPLYIGILDRVSDDCLIEDNKVTIKHNDDALVISMIDTNKLLCTVKGDWSNRHPIEIEQMLRVHNLRHNTITDTKDIISVYVAVRESSYLDILVATHDSMTIEYMNETRYVKTTRNLFPLFMHCSDCIIKE